MTPPYSKRGKQRISFNKLLIVRNTNTVNSPKLADTMRIKTANEHLTKTKEFLFKGDKYLEYTYWIYLAVW